MMRAALPRSAILESPEVRAFRFGVAQTRERARIVALGTHLTPHPISTVVPKGFVHPPDEPDRQAPTMFRHNVVDERGGHEDRGIPRTGRTRQHAEPDQPTVQAHRVD